MSNIFDDAKKLLVVSATREQQQNLARKKSDENRLLIIRLNHFFQSPDADDLVDFVGYFPETKLEYGYLYDPSPNQPSVKASSQASPKPASQYFCVKYVVRDMGKIYLVPLSENGLMIVLKPARYLRHPFTSQGESYPGLTTQYLLSADQLFDVLFSWAKTYLAYKRKVE